jgi:hypothetical protein
MMKRAIAIASLVGVLGFVTGADAGQLFQARLSGAEEVPPVETDTTGRFQILFNRVATAGEFTLRVHEGVRITQAHLHCGEAGVNGPVIVFLAGNHDLGWDVDGQWVSKATITDENVTNDTCGMTLADIVEEARAGRVYVNVHSVAHPAGVVRGQLLPAGR